MSKVDKFKFVGGPRDGLELENGLGFIPDIIDGNAFHLFGPKAYAVMEIDYDEGVATFEHMRLVNGTVAGAASQGDDV